MLISFVDSVNHARSAETVFPYLRFLFLGIFVIHTIKKSEALDKINLIIFIVMSFWCIDAAVQYEFKIDLFGNPYEPGHITGVFYPRLTLGHITACLSPIFFESLRKHGGNQRWLWLFLPLLVFTVFLSGRRSAWIMLAVGLAGYIIYLYFVMESKKLFSKRSIVAGALTIAALLVVVSYDKPLQNRLVKPAVLLSGDFEQIDIATSNRLHIWGVSISMFKSNWFNGVGPRAYRYAYGDYVSSNDYWMSKGEEYGPNHPHQIVLEILSETGLLGFFGLLFFIYLFLTSIKKYRMVKTSFPWLLCVIIAIFPLNTHMAIYGSYWATVFWWLVTMAFVASAVSDKIDREN